MTDRPWDPGLQPERTALAWQRTTLSGLACGLVVARLLAGASLLLAVGFSLAVVSGSLLASRYTARREQATEKALHRRARLPDGRAHLTVSGLTCLTAVGALLYVWTG